jgi:polyisoprenoid-binding protein YceI
MNFFLTLIALFIFSATSTTSTSNKDHHSAPSNDAKEWRIDQSHSAVNFKIRHFFTPVPGVFERWGGTIKFDPDNLEGSMIDINIEVASVNTKNERRDNHLRTADFFEAETYPNMTFVSHSIRQTGENTFVATGNLTIKETTKTIELPFELLGAMPHPSRENTTVAGFKSELSILRNEYGVGTGDYIQTVVIGDEVSIEIFLEVNG